MYKPEFLNPWERPQYYIGGGLYGWYSVIGQHRDSNLLDQSNFNAVLNELKTLEPWPEVEDNDGNMVDAVQVYNFGHWAVGWIESIYIHESYEEGLTLADELIGRLEDYPVLVEDDYYQREHEDFCETVLNYWVPDFSSFCEDVVCDDEEFEKFRQELLYQDNDWIATLALDSGEYGIDLYDHYDSGGLDNKLWGIEVMWKMFQQMFRLWTVREAERKADGWEQLPLIQG